MLAFLLLVSLARPVDTASGRVVRAAGTDTAAAGGALVILHRVSPAVQGAVDSVRADADGRFAFRFDADTASTYLVSARWGGIEYFAPPIGDTRAPVTIVVSDTAAAAPITMTARHVVVSGPATDGTRTVVDLVVIDNAGDRTRVPAAADAPTWRLRVPAHAVNVRVADSDFAVTAFDQHGDTLLLHAAVPPGERQIFIEYQLAPGTTALVIPVDSPVASLNVMTEERVRVGSMRAQADTTVNDRLFHRWSASFDRATEVRLSFGAPTAPGWLIPLLGTLLAGALVALTAWALRPRPAAVAGRDNADALIDAIARLDAAHTAGAANTEPGAWQAYLAERAQLKRRLEEWLAP